VFPARTIYVITREFQDFLLEPTSRLATHKVRHVHTRFLDNLTAAQQAIFTSQFRYAFATAQVCYAETATLWSHSA